ncbi:hypothetical protein F5B22DRAFT_605733 [Xylaria bambusicola]|uniref:uncharacterized protein n=1 Tax=Xylaria bambusicola TaxID=326684 RepID=UPI002007FCA3|nr:uncharacterized protein F5B22DRAFT_605733 [Xylaria bambusicola]KAI0516977.1 hypothetical protein F5B22DRAFT_605733 [Xylaria bambusicola]
MSVWSSSESSMVSDDQFPEAEPYDWHRRAGPSTRPDPQQSWYPPNNYFQYPGIAPYSANNLMSYAQHPAQNPTFRARWDAFNLFDEEEQERRKKGKEIMPIRPVMNGPPPRWTFYPGGYGPAPYYAPLGNPFPSGLPQSQPLPLPLPTAGNSGDTSKKHTKHVRQPDQVPGTRQGEGTRGGESKIIQKIDGILTPSSEDLTVHLTMHLEEDLEDFLDELSCLSRLGHFSSAQKFFQEHLHHHIDNPYVLVCWADLLLRQGDFKGVTLIKDDAMYKNEGEQSTAEELKLLRLNWELIQTLAKSMTLDTNSAASTVSEEAIEVLTAIAKGSTLDGSISSIEIEIIALALRLAGHPVLISTWVKHGAKDINTPFSRLYGTLLRQGRIWDFHDLVVFWPKIEDIKTLLQDIFDKDLIPSLEAMISDWLESIHGYDSSTTLGLLSIMTYVMLEPVQASEKECIDILKLCLPLAISVAKNDPSGLKSRPYLRVLLAKSRFSETASRQAMDSLSAQLQSAQGVSYCPDVALLPIYVPFENETPQWAAMDQPRELKDPIRLVLRSVVELGDLQTEVIARRELIRLSKNPRDEFDLLCTLQLARQGDLSGYGLTLASKYLVSNTKEAKEELAILISRLLSKITAINFWDPSCEWILNMLLYKLEGKSPSIIQEMLERSHANYQQMDDSLLREISRKMPILKDWVSQQTRVSTEDRPRNTAPRTRSASRRSKELKPNKTKSPGIAQATGQPTTRTQRESFHERREAQDTPLATGSKSTDKRQDQEPNLDGAHPHTQMPNDEQIGTADEPRNVQEIPISTFSRPNDESQGGRESVDVNISQATSLPIESQNRRRSLHTQTYRAANLLARERPKDDIKLAEDIRKRLAAEYDRKLDAERNFEQERQKERSALLEELKKEVEAIRREAVEQAEKKARVEAQERAEQLRWERQLQESKLQKEIATVKAKAVEAERDARFEAEREAALRQAEKKIKEEIEIQKMKDEEAQKKAAHERHQKMEAERRAREEAEAKKRYKEELERKAAAERHEADKKARDAATRQVEEEETRQWAAEQAQRDLETQNQIHFKDAIGRKFAIPFSEGRTWQRMRELIEATFAHIDGLAAEVQAGHYDLVDPDGSIILPQTWDQIIQPGWNIQMQMWPMVPGPAQPAAVPPPPVPFTIPSVVPPPPAPPVANQGVTVIESEGQGRVSSEHADADDDDDISSGYGSDPGARRRSPRKKIAHAFAALKASVLRRRRRSASITSTESSLRSFDD